MREDDKNTQRSECSECSEYDVLLARLGRAEKLASLGILTASVATHFDEILAPLTEAIDYALTSDDPNATSHALQLAAGASAKAAVIAESLISFNKSHQTKPDLADLTEIILTFAHLIEGTLGKKNIKLNLDLHRVPIMPIETNHLHQVLGILMTNAEEAMSNGGEITINLTADESDINITFSDTGNGISQTDLPLIFEPFFTTKTKSSETRNPNLGLGLAIARSKVCEMGGTIHVKSKPLSGTQIYITLPKA